MLHNSEKTSEPRHDLGYHARTAAVTLLCAVIVLGMRIGGIPSTINAFGIAFPLSDFFIIVGAGLCGYRYGLGLFLIIYSVETIDRADGIISSFALILYLAVALLSGVFSERRWFLSKWKTLLAGLLLEGTLASLFYLIFAFVMRGRWRNLSQSILATIPETVVAVLFLYLYFRFAPDIVKNRFGVGERYTANYVPPENSNSLSRQITILSLSESVIFGVISAVLTNGVLMIFYGNQQSFVIGEIYDGLTLTFSRTMLLIIGFLFGWMLSLAVSVIVNEIIVGNIISIVRRQGQLETALAVSEAGSEAKSAFLSSMSHEIRTPINAVLGMDEMIARESEDDQILEYAENIRVAGNTLLGLVNDVLDFSKIEAGKMDIIPVEYSTASLFHDLTTLIAARAEKKGLALKLEIDKNLPSTLYGDEIRVKQIITNILTNAVKYTEKGSVTLSSRFSRTDEENGVLFVSVRDTGIGIKEEDMQKLFGAFERIEEKRNRNIEGTGLGMSITTRLLSMMGSKLEVESVYGEGSDFYFSLNQRVVSWESVGDIEKRWKELVQSRGRYQASFTAEGARILAVDDTPINLTVLRGLLKPTKITVDTAGSGVECLEKIKERQYDLIFLDHRMPEMSGPETRERMKKLPGNRNEATPVIALTANVSSDAKEEYERLGFSGYLAKPIDSTLLEEILRTHLPAEKVKIAGDEDAAHDESGKSEMGKIKRLQSVPDLDFDLAMKNCLEDSILLESATVFAELGDEGIRKIQDFLEKNDIKNYTIQVHALKSSSRLIGFAELSDLAARLEKSGDQEDLEELTKGTPELLSRYRDAVENLRFLTASAGAAGDEEAPKNELPEIDEARLTEAYGAILELTKVLDYDAAGAVLSELEHFQLPPAEKERVKEIRSAITALNPAKVAEVIQR